MAEFIFRSTKYTYQEKDVVWRIKNNLDKCIKDQKKNDEKQLKMFDIEKSSVYMIYIRFCSTSSVASEVKPKFTFISFYNIKILL